MSATDLSPADEALMSARRNELFAAIAKLSLLQQQVMECRLAGLSGPEIADRLGMPLPKIKSAQYRAYRLLRDDLEDWHPANDGGGDRP